MKIISIIQDSVFDVCGVKYVNVMQEAEGTTFKGTMLKSEAELRQTLQTICPDKVEQVMQQVNDYAIERQAENEID